MQNAPVLINTGLAAGELTLGTGSGSFTKSPPSPITVEQAQNLVNNPAGFYFNVHTQLNRRRGDPRRSWCGCNKPDRGLRNQAIVSGTARGIRPDSTAERD